MYCKSVEFPYQNLVIAKDQPQYTPLPVCVLGENQSVVSCWEIPPEALEEVRKTGKIYIQVMTFGKPLLPLRVATDISDFIEIV